MVRFLYQSALLIKFLIRKIHLLLPRSCLLITFKTHTRPPQAPAATS
jgi:hypothetical protein